MIERQPDPPRDLSTTRVGGGGSARAVALVTLVTLATVVWVGFSGRKPEPPISARVDAPAPLLVAAASPASADPAASPLAIAPWQTRYIESLPLRHAGPLGQDAYSIIATFAGREYPVLLDEIAPRHLTAAYRIPFPRPATSGTLRLAQLWSRGAARNYVPIGRWHVPLDPLAPETRRAANVIDVTVAGRRGLVGAPRLLSRGYRLTVRAESRLNSGVLWIDIRIGPGHSIRGDDGIFGWPVVLQLSGEDASR